MTFSHANLDGLVYSVSGGQTVRPFPSGKTPSANAASSIWDGDTLSLNITLDDDSTEQITLTEAEIDAQMSETAL